MIGAKINIEQFKRGFFDRAIVSKLPKAKRAALSKFGGRVRLRARRSIRKRKGTSRPGEPPHSHAPHLLRSFILYAYDAEAESVVAGPAKLDGKIGNAPEALEKGGPSVIEVRRRGSRRREKITIAARPYMQPAFDAEKATAAKDFKNTIR